MEGSLCFDPIMCNTWSGEEPKHFWRPTDILQDYLSVSHPICKIFELLLTLMLEYKGKNA